MSCEAWIDVDETGRITDAGYGGGGLMGSTTIKLGGLRHRFQAVQLPDLQREPEQADGSVRFVQTAGGRTGLPAPRRVQHRPYVQWQAPLVWTTLSLTLHADGRAEYAMTGASAFPRHWVYDGDGKLSHKSGLTDFRDWYGKSFGRHSPWGDEDSAGAGHRGRDRAGAGAVRAADARRRQAKDRPAAGRRDGGPAAATTAPMSSSCSTGSSGWSATASSWPSTGRARCSASGPTSKAASGRLRSSPSPPCRLAAVDASQLDRSALEELSGGHRREDAGQA